MNPSRLIIVCQRSCPIGVAPFPTGPLVTACARISSRIEALTAVQPSTPRTLELTQSAARRRDLRATMRTHDQPAGVRTCFGTVSPFLRPSGDLARRIRPPTRHQRSSGRLLNGLPILIARSILPSLKAERSTELPNPDVVALSIGKFSVACSVNVSVACESVGSSSPPHAARTRAEAAGGKRLGTSFAFVYVVRDVLLS